MQHFDIIYAGSCVLLLLVLVSFPQKSQVHAVSAVAQAMHALLCWRTLTTS